MSSSSVWVLSKTFYDAANGQWYMQGTRMPSSDEEGADDTIHVVGASFPETLHGWEQQVRLRCPVARPKIDRKLFEEFRDALTRGGKTEEDYEITGSDE